MEDILNFTSYIPTYPIFNILELDISFCEVKISDPYFSSKKKLEGVTTQETTQKILNLLKENPEYSRKKLANIIGDVTEEGIKYNLEKLKEEGRIKRVGPDKGGYWKVLD